MMKSKIKKQLSFSFSLFISLLVSTSLMAADLPTGGEIVGGSGSIHQSGNTMTVTQDTAKLAANWQSFSIGAGNTVNFVQPSASSIALNRVIGSDVSVIQGALNANGHVFLINPNGVLFTPSAQVNVGGLVASTLQLSTEDFLAGHYAFEGDSVASVMNQGTIKTSNGGDVAFIAARIINEGSIVADQGNILMGAGSKIIIDLGGPVKLEIEKGALETLIEQGGAIRANGGKIYLTTKAAGELATSVINHTGVSEAKTLVTGEKGEIILLGDMNVGVTNVAGILDASAPFAGDGGFIETSASEVKLAEEGLNITASSAYGKGGEWLIDPTDYTINAAAAGNIAGTLNTGTNVTVTTAASVAGHGATGAGNGDITVASAIAKTAGGDAKLSLLAANTIAINAEITSTAGKLDLLLDADNDNGTRNGGGVIIATKGVRLNGGKLDFGTGATETINGTATLVGGDVYIGGTEQVEFITGGGAVNLYGELIIANEEGVKFTTSGGNAHFFGIINSGNKYEKLTNGAGYTWDAAFADAKNGTAGGSAVGDQYLATVTSRLENSVVVYTGEFAAGAGLADGAWLGGRRVTGIGTDNLWRWVSGPEAASDSGKGLAFNNGATSVSPVDSAFNNWQAGEPNNAGGEDRLQIGDAQGRWNDLPNTSGLNQKIYIRETNFDTADLEIDAGSGTVTFDKDIGGLKSINYKAYDASNPNPNTTAATTTTASTPPAPQTTAVAVAQSSSTTTRKTENNSAPRDFLNAPTKNVKLSQGNSQQSIGGVGSMDIVEVNSETEIELQGNSAPQPGTTPSEFTKLFVVDGGVNETVGANTNSDEE